MLQPDAASGSLHDISDPHEPCMNSSYHMTCLIFDGSVKQQLLCLTTCVNINHALMIAVPMPDTQAHAVADVWGVCMPMQTATNLEDSRVES